MINVGVIGSTKGTDLQAILDSIKSGNLDANISIVISNRSGAYILKRAQNHGIPSVFIDHKDSYA